MVRKFVAVAFALLLIGATAGAAQVSVGVGGQYLSLGGDDFSGINAGFGAEGNVMFPVASNIRVGASGQWATHGIEGASENLTTIGAFGEARYMFTMGEGGKATPYVAGRGGYVRYSVSSGGSSASASGFGFGGGVGVMIALSPGLAVDLNGIFHSLSFGDASVDGSSISGTDAKGTALQIRGGVNFKLGGGNGGM